jgi:hypothetical protein
VEAFKWAREEVLEDATLLKLVVIQQVAKISQIKHACSMQMVPSQQKTLLTIFGLCLRLTQMLAVRVTGMTKG